MIKLFSLLITVPLSLCVLLFAVSNTQIVTVHLNMFDYERALPQYALSLGLAGIGFLAGGFLVWLNLYRYRIRYWQAQRKLTKYEAEIARLKTETEAAKEENLNPAPVAYRLAANE